MITGVILAHNQELTFLALSGLATWDYENHSR